ncbi:hypothetical protein PVK06_039605 [Gossypium arboreum]|uniref:Reverse transcriptase n=1 Tax=Gossypium arboreum TaxID=29729 RepID=A0ABR0N3D9_GOSAR|nr:hypothetical protein PVK06_039605 [Gossypium arboreum]
MVANRFQKALEDYIDSSQSAFVSERLISNNVLLAYEILHTFGQKRSGRKGLMAFKLDMNKTYDRLKEDEGLGFRSFAKFNVALLAKQGWRLISNPNSLLGKVLKAKYYPNSDFLNSSFMAGVSYTWRSIWAAKKTLQDVDELNSVNREWSSVIITDVFDFVDATRILRIPLTKIPHNDGLMWRGEPSGTAICPRCRDGVETLAHVFRSCPVANEV